MFLIIKRITALTGLGEVVLQMNRETSVAWVYACSPFGAATESPVPRSTALKMLLPAPEACIGSLPPIGADMRISWVHCTVNDNRLMVTLIQHRQIHRFAGIFHQFAQNGMDNCQQIAAL